ncbi:MAG: hypothetical protein ACI30I_08980 [Parabacteroides sp.]
MKDVKIKDAPLVEQVQGTEKIPVSDGSGQPKAVTVGQIRSGLATEESVGSAIEHATNMVTDHDGSADAHPDIRESISSSVSAHNADGYSHPSILSVIQEVRSIAEGRSRAFVFDTVETLDEWISVADNTAQLKAGDNLLVRALDVPDYWWDGSGRQPLETGKIDLTVYYTKEETDAKIEDLSKAVEGIDASLDLLIEKKDSLGDATAVNLDMENFPTYNGLPSVIIGSGAPSEAPGFIGQKYMDTAAKKLYIAFGYSSTGDWVAMN